MQIIPTLAAAPTAPGTPAASLGSVPGGAGAFGQILAAGLGSGPGAAGAFGPILAAGRQGPLSALSALGAALMPSGEEAIEPPAGGLDAGLLWALRPEEQVEQVEDALESGLAAALIPPPTIQADIPGEMPAEQETLPTIVPILESEGEADRMDIAAPKGAEPAQMPVAAAGEILARMPRIDAGDRPTAPAQTGEAAPPADRGHACPFENVNDLQPAAQTGRPGLLQKTGAAAETASPAPAEAEAPLGPKAPEKAAESLGPAPRRPESETPLEAPALAQPGRPIELGALRAQAAAQGPRPAEATRETLMDTLVEEISVETGQRERTVDIQLRPEFLGKVHIRLTLDETGLRARIRAESPEARGLMSGQLSQLTEALQAKGVRVSQIEVTAAGQGAYAFNPSAGGREQAGRDERGQPRRSWRPEGVSRAREAEGFEAPEIDPETGSVTYRI